jgi:hypothetical protein
MELTVNNWTFQMRHHLQIVVVLDVVARDRGDLPIDYHKFAMESPEWRSMKVNDCEINIGHLLGCG